MNIAFVVNNIQTEKADFTTILLAKKLHNLEHNVFFINVENLLYTPEGHMGGYAVKASRKTFKSTETYLNALQGEDNEKHRILASDLDILMLRNDPSTELASRSWAANAGLIFGQVALNDGVIVLNDPGSLAHAANKMYFQHFPEEVRPNTVITRHTQEILDFFHANKQKIILKPLQGSGGKGVFLVKKDTIGNLNQIIEAISRDGYVIAQEYIPEAQQGDTRLLVMNGKPLQYKGKYAAVHRQSSGADIRSNIHSGGTATDAEVTDEMLKIVEIIRPKLINDGMFLVGLDIVGSRLLEVNVFSPGGLVAASRLKNADFTVAVIESLERKAYYKKIYNHQINNRKLATME